MVAVLMGCKYDDDKLWDVVNNLDSRLTKVENLLSQLNGNVGSLQTIVYAIQQNTYITNLQQTSQGYNITFSDGRTITLFNGETPYNGDNGNWWIGSRDTGVKAQGSDGLTPYVGDNGNWWIGNNDTGVRAIGKDGKTPYIGSNGNWWIDGKDTGTVAKGETPYIGTNGNWWIGNKDTGVKAGGTGGDDNSLVPIIGMDEVDGVYYWTTTINGTTSWLLDKNGNKMPVTAFAPIFKSDAYDFLVYSVDGGVTWNYIYDVYGYPISLGGGSGNCNCRQFFKDVYVQGDYLYIILIDGTVVKIRISGNDYNIPDDPTDPTPTLPGDPNVPIPNPNVTPDVDSYGNYIVTMNLTGIQDPNTGEWIDLYGTGLSKQNVWVEVDHSPEGILVTNLDENTSTVKNDIAFIVDNSGSMSEEADAVAKGIINWASMLTNKGLDVKFAVVGYDVNGAVSGALNLTTVSTLNSYLSRSTGTQRTVGFAGSDASTLKSKASSYTGVTDECGALAIKYANDVVNYRAGANRIYINFTDEPNQPNGKSIYSVEWFKSQSNWPVQNGTVHTVWSAGTPYSTYYSSYDKVNYCEDPFKISDYTGGTKMSVKADASDLNLNQLTVSGAMTHAYTIRFMIPASYLDGRAHIVRIVVIANNGTVRGQLSFQVTFGSI
jgi:hypothetical protein